MLRLCVEFARKRVRFGCVAAARNKGKKIYRVRLGLRPGGLVVCVGPKKEKKEK